MTSRADLAADLPEPLAEGADTAQRSPGRCPLCTAAITRGQRYARLVPSGYPAHVTCISETAGTLA